MYVCAPINVFCFVFVSRKVCELHTICLLEKLINGNPPKRLFSAA